MPVSPTHPGVYIQEVPSGVRSIVGVATSVAAFVDSFARGPFNQAVRVFSFGDFERIYGGFADLALTLRQLGLASAEVEDILPPNMRYLEGSAEPPAEATTSSPAPPSARSWTRSTSSTPPCARSSRRPRATCTSSSTSTPTTRTCGCCRGSTPPWPTATRS